MSIFVITELMFFTGLISAFMVIKSGAPRWAPPAEVVLPVWTTMFNTAVLSSSGILLLLAGRYLQRDLRSSTASYLTLWAIALGGFFVAFQGYEWVNLIGYGMTLNSDIFGACFYLLIGSHGLHAAAALVALIFMYRKLVMARLPLASFRAMQILWVFVVGMWPILYALVYFPD